MSELRSELRSIRWLGDLRRVTWDDVRACELRDLVE